MQTAARLWGIMLSSTTQTVITIQPLVLTRSKLIHTVPKTRQLVLGLSYKVPATIISPSALQPAHFLPWAIATFMSVVEVTSPRTTPFASANHNFTPLRLSLALTEPTR